MRILIIEDEIKAAKELKFLIEQMHKSFEVCAILQSVEDSIEWFGKNPMPNLIISDIQLSDGLSFDIFRTIRLHAPVIFCTAYDDFALDAFEANGIDYMLKPIDKGKLKKSFEKMVAFKGFLDYEPPKFPGHFDDMLNQVYGNGYKNAILVYVGDRIISVKTQEISLIISTNNIAYLYANNKKFEIKETLESIIAELNPHDFYRANRQTIISRKSILNVRQSDARKLELITGISTLQPIIVSKEKASAFLKWMRSN